MLKTIKPIFCVIHTCCLNSKTVLRTYCRNIIYITTPKTTDRGLLLCPLKCLYCTALSRLLRTRMRPLIVGSHHHTRAIFITNIYILYYTAWLPTRKKNMLYCAYITSAWMLIFILYKKYTNPSRIHLPRFKI